MKIYKTNLFLYLAEYFKFTFGDVAQLVRVFAWQARSRGFESHLLHSNTKSKLLTAHFLYE